MNGTLHGLIQKARIDASAHEYKIHQGGAGYRVWRMSPIGWLCVGELSNYEDAEDFLVGKLTQEDR